MSEYVQVIRVKMVAAEVQLETCMTHMTALLVRAYGSNPFMQFGTLKIGPS